MTRPFLSIQGIRKDYGGFTAIKDVTLDIARGEFMTFLGPSGSGKSTTLYILAGFQDPTEGDILLDGESLLPVPSHKRNIGMVFQRYTLFPHLSVGENVAFPLRVRRCAKSEIEDRVHAALKLVHLEDFAGRKPALMSGGQQQRVALARALVYDPPLLLMDEPLSALDKKLREELQFEIRRIHQETGVTILYVTHDQEEALRLSDRISVFSQGGIEQIGTGQEQPMRSPRPVSWRASSATAISWRPTSFPWRRTRRSCPSATASSSTASRSRGARRTRTARRCCCGRNGSPSRSRGRNAACP
ncbi:Vitamin B12 import ATP-binding protein BtuD [Castellaniella denitrificans]